MQTLYNIYTAHYLLTEVHSVHITLRH